MSTIKILLFLSESHVYSIFLKSIMQYLHINNCKYNLSYILICFIVREEIVVASKIHLYEEERTLNQVETENGVKNDRTIHTNILKFVPYQLIQSIYTKLVCRRYKLSLILYYFKYWTTVGILKYRPKSLIFFLIFYFEASFHFFFHFTLRYLGNWMFTF